jgi:ATP-dependent exoDNAse (exonuclease V) beta subunit
MFNLQLSELQKLPRKNVDGKRVYETPDGKHYPSVTTITSQLSKDAIVAWRKRVGNEAANKITTKATRRGTSVHKLCEDYCLNKLMEDKVMPSNKEMFFSIKKELDANVNNIRSVEGFLYSDFLQVAGQVDLIAEYKGKLSIIDFKTSKKRKPEAWCEGYFIQESAYAFMFEERTGIRVPQLVTIIGVDDEPEPQVFVKNCSERNKYLLKFQKLREAFDL